jgi:hypothetical protein
MSNPSPAPATPAATTQTTPEWEDRTFDFFKHLTTLNFAAIGFVMVLIEREGLLKYPKDQAFLGPFSWFVGSLVGSFVMMLCVMRPISFADKEGETNARKVVTVIGICAVVAFMIGLWWLAAITGVVETKK